MTFATDGGDVYAVKDVSLEVNPGEVVAIVGESGSGKTVTAKTILGLLPETAISSGAVLINGNNVISVSAAEAAARSAAATWPWCSRNRPPRSTRSSPWAGRSPRASGPTPARTADKVCAKEAKARAIDALRKVGIPDPETRVNYYPHQFSGGQKQRVVIAAALALNPGLIVADEPTTALDVTVQAEILELLRDLRDQYGTSIVLITHNMGVVADLADRVVGHVPGRRRRRGAARVLFAEPKQDYTKKLLAAVPHLGRQLRLGGHDRTAHQGGKVLVEATEPHHRVPRPAGQPGLQGRGRRQLHPVRGRGLRPRRRVGLRQDHDRPGHRGPEPDHGRQPARCSATRCSTSRSAPSSRCASEIGFVFQDPAASFNPQLTIGDCIAEPLIIHTQADAGAGPPAARRAARIGAAAGVLRATGTRTNSPAASGSAPRLARALILNPKLLIADEPTSALDVSVQAKVLELFKEIQAEFGFACLFISHDLAVVDILSPLGRGALQGQDGRAGPRQPGDGQPAARLHEEAHRVTARPGSRRAGAAPRGVPRRAARLRATDTCPRDMPTVRRERWACPSFPAVSERPGAATVLNSRRD